MSAPSDPASGRELLTRAIDVSVRVGAIAILAVWCFQITRPFIAPAVWGIIIATATHPMYARFRAILGGRGRLAAGLLTLAALCLLLIPTLMFAGSMVESVQWLVSSLKDGTLNISPPPEQVASWPLIGEWIDQIWTLASVNLEEAIRKVGPHLTPLGAGLLSATAGAGLGLLQFVVSIGIAGVLLSNSSAGSRAAHAVATRLAGDRGAEFASLAGATVRGVAQGILGVALIQTLLIGIGLYVAAIPHAGLWTLLCLMLAVIQLPTFLVVLPIIIYVFSTSGTVTTVVFTIWMLVAGGSDSVLKPILLGRGLDLPMLVIFVGAIGGFITSGFIVLFVGAVVLALGYQLFMAWLHREAQTQDAPDSATP